MVCAVCMNLIGLCLDYFINICSHGNETMADIPNFKLLALRGKSLISTTTFLFWLSYLDSVRINENDTAILFQTLLTVKIL